MELENCYLKDFGYEKFEKMVNMIGGKWKTFAIRKHYIILIRSISVSVTKQCVR